MGFSSKIEKPIFLFLTQVVWYFYVLYSCEEKKGRVKVQNHQYVLHFEHSPHCS